jgi:hypothetical protein
MSAHYALGYRQSGVPKMPVCFDRKLALIHIPKTAGGSLTQALGLQHEENFYAPKYDAYCYEGITYAPQHLTPRLLAQLVPDFDAFTTVCFTRHPYEKVVSEYFWLKRDYERRPVRWYRESRLREWIETSLSKKDMDHKLDQYTYAKDCNLVFSMAHLRQGTAAIERLLGTTLHQSRRFRASWLFSRWTGCGWPSHRPTGYRLAAGCGCFVLVAALNSSSTLAAPLS